MNTQPPIMSPTMQLLLQALEQGVEEVKANGPQGDPLQGVR